MRAFLAAAARDGDDIADASILDANMSIAYRYEHVGLLTGHGTHPPLKRCARFLSSGPGLRDMPAVAPGLVATTLGDMDASDDRSGAARAEGG